MCVCCVGIHFLGWIALRMCPTQSLCSDTCQGLCVCGECLCPECTTFEPNNTCLSACCDATSKLCAISNKVRREFSKECVFFFFFFFFIFFSGNFASPDWLRSCQRIFLHQVHLLSFNGSVWSRYHLLEFLWM
jgi:hypothetical protein